MTDRHDYGSIFLPPAEAQAEDSQRPTVDDSDEAMDRLRYPFDVQRTGGQRPA